MSPDRNGTIRFGSGAHSSIPWASSSKQPSIASCFSKTATKAGTGGFESANRSWTDSVILGLSPCRRRAERQHSREDGPDPPVSHCSEKLLDEPLFEWIPTSAQALWSGAVHVRQFDGLTLRIAFIPLPQLLHALRGIAVVVDPHPTIQSVGEKIEKRDG